MKRDKSYGFFKHILGETLVNRFDEIALKSVYKRWKLESFRSEMKRGSSFNCPQYSMSVKNGYNKKEAVFLMKNLYDEIFPMWIRKGVCGNFQDVNGTYGGGEIYSFTKEEQLDMMHMDSLKEKERFKAKILKQKTNRVVEAPGVFSVCFLRWRKAIRVRIQNFNTWLEDLKSFPILSLFWKIAVGLSVISGVVGLFIIFK